MRSPEAYSIRCAAYHAPSTAPRHRYDARPWARTAAALADLARRVHAGELDLAEATAAHPFPEMPPDHAVDAFRRAVAQLRGEIGVA